MGDAREAEKAPDAFRTISEVADDLELPQHVLRFWESRFAQIKPVKRAGGRRFYRPEDVDLLRGIRHLLYTDGYTIKGAQRILKDQGVRFVQDLGIEREVAVMRSARPPREAAADGVTFGGLLGLLPRRRPKGKGGRDDEILPELPPVAELPLPFPDQEADRDLEGDATVPPLALRPGSAEPPQRARAERREPQVERHEPGHREPERHNAAERATSRERREPLMDMPRRDDEDWQAPAGAPAHLPPFGSPTGRDPRTAAPEEPLPNNRRPPQRPRPDADRRIEPAFAPQRPTRGPAARIASPEERGAHPPELDDPLLPFLDDTTPQGVSEPIEARIRRLKAQDRPSRRAFGEQEDWREEPVAGHREAPGFDTRTEPPFREPQARAEQGPPEEYIPARARRPATAPPPAAPEPDRDGFGSMPLSRDGVGHRRPRPPAREEGARRPAVYDDDWQQTDWVEEAQAVARPRQRDAATAGQGGDVPFARGDRAAPERPTQDRLMNERHADDPFIEERIAEERIMHSRVVRERTMHDRSTRDLLIDDQLDQNRFVQDRAGRVAEDAYLENRSMDHDRPRPSAGLPPSDRREVPMPPAGERVMRRPAGPSAAREAGTAWSEAWTDAWGDAPPQALPRATRIGPLIGPIDEEEPDSPAPRRSATEPPRAPWSHPDAPVTGTGSAGRPVTASMPPEPPQEPPARAPREPLRHGPPEQYLPPHLRSEPRVVGHAPLVAPVLSRDDVHRLQSVLYELGECRRLVEGVLGARDEARDAG